MPKRPLGEEDTKLLGKLLAARGGIVSDAAILPRPTVLGALVAVLAVACFASGYVVAYRQGLSHYEQLRDDLNAQDRFFEGKLMECNLHRTQLHDKFEVTAASADSDPRVRKLIKIRDNVECMKARLHSRVEHSAKRIRLIQGKIIHYEQAYFEAVKEYLDIDKFPVTIAPKCTRFIHARRRLLARTGGAAELEGGVEEELVPLR